MIVEIKNTYLIELSIFVTYVKVLLNIIFYLLTGMGEVVGRAEEKEAICKKQKRGGRDPLMCKLFPDSESLNTLPQLDRLIHEEFIRVHSFFATIVQREVGITLKIPLFVGGAYSSVSSICGPMTGAAYCPGGEGVLMINPHSLYQIFMDYDLEGTDAVRFVVAHEYIHHVQAQLLYYKKIIPLNQTEEGRILVKYEVDPQSVEYNNLSKFIGYFKKSFELSEQEAGLFLEKIANITYFLTKSPRIEALTSKYFELWPDFLAGFYLARQIGMKALDKDRTDLIVRSIGNIGDEKVMCQNGGLQERNKGGCVLKLEQIKHGLGSDRQLAFLSGYALASTNKESDSIIGGFRLDYSIPEGGLLYRSELLDQLMEEVVDK